MDSDDERPPSGIREVTTPAEGRSFTAATLDGQCPAAIETAQLLVSELVTNALLHAREPAVELAVQIVDGHAKIAVTDHSAVLPELPELDPTTVGGLGLHIVDALSHRWGITPTGEGKTVWVELGCDHALAS